MRDRSLQTKEDWTGYWIRAALAAKNLPPRTKFTLQELREDLALNTAIADGMRQYYEWVYDQEVADRFVQQYERSQFTQLGIDWLLACIESYARADGRAGLDLDTATNAVAIGTVVVSKPRERRR